MTRIQAFLISLRSSWPSARKLLWDAQSCFSSGWGKPFFFLTSPLSAPPQYGFHLSAENAAKTAAFSADKCFSALSRGTQAPQDTGLCGAGACILADSLGQSLYRIGKEDPSRVSPVRKNQGADVKFAGGGVPRQRSILA